jgi:hypothetical protein
LWLPAIAGLGTSCHMQSSAGNRTVAEGAATNVCIVPSSLSSTAAAADVALRSL